MSAEEDLDQFEAEVELELYREYRAVFPMFRYVVETERRFYLANDVKVTPRSGPGATYFEVELDRRLGLGHVPSGPLRVLGARRHLQRRECGGTAERRGLRGTRLLRLGPETTR